MAFMARGKNQRSTVAKANADAQNRIAELEEELATFKAAGIVAADYLAALADNERLRAKVLRLEHEATKVPKLEAMLDAAIKHRDQWKSQAETTWVWARRLIDHSRDYLPDVQRQVFVGHMRSTSDEFAKLDRDAVANPDLVAAMRRHMAPVDDLSPAAASALDDLIISGSASDAS